MPLHPHAGLLCLKAGAKGLAQKHLTEAVQLFSDLDEEGHEANFIAVLLELGQHYVKQHQLDFGKGCYEWALLLAINASLLDCKYVSHTFVLLFCYCVLRSSFYFCSSQ